MSSLNSTLVLVQQGLIRYVYSTYLLIGVTGSCLNIILLTRREFRAVSCCIYFITMSIMAIIGLIITDVPLIYSLYYNDPYTTIVAVCKIRTYMLQFSSMMYRWCLVAACFDRYALTSTNARLRNFGTVRVAYRVTAVLTVIWLLLPIYIFIFFDLRRGGCSISDDIGLSLFNSIFFIASGSVLPVSLMFVCTMLIRHNLLLKWRRRGQLANNQGNNNEHIQRKRDGHVVAMLLLQVLVFAVTQTPRMLFLIYSTATIKISDKSIDRVLIERFLGFMSDMIVALLPVLSFYLHTLVSRTFRDEFMKLLRCPIICRRPHINNRINPLAPEVILRTDIRPIQILASI